MLCAGLCWISVPAHAEPPATGQEAPTSPPAETAPSVPVQASANLTLEVGDPLFFKLDPLSHEPVKLIVRVLCPNENVEQIEATVMHVRSPSGALAAEPDIGAKVARNKGSCSFDISLLPSPKALLGVGTHTITLRLAAYPATGSGQSAQPTILIKQVQVERSAVALDLKLPVVRLERSLPCLTSASGSFRVPLQLAGTGNLPDCKAQVSELVRENASGSVRDTNYGSVSISPDCSKGVLDLYFSRIGSVGSLTTTVTITAPALGDSPRIVPIRVVVTDQPWAGLFAILAGVALALGAQILTERVRRKQVTSLRIARLAGRIDRLLHRTQDSETLAEIRAIDEGLEGLRRRIQAGDIPGVAEINAAANAISELEANVDKVISKQKAGSGRHGARPSDDLSGDYESVSIGQKPVAPAPRVELVVIDEFVRAGSEITLEIRPKDAPEIKDCKFRWHMGGTGAPKETERPQLLHTFERAGVKELKVSALRGDEEVAKYELRLPVAPSAVEEDIQSEAKRLLLTDAMISGVSALVAVIAAYSALYDPAVPFGTGKDYVTAFLWGFGFDSGMRGVLPVLKGLRNSGQEGSD